MTRIENHCRDCAAPGYPCRGVLCPFTRVKVIYCDRCGEPIDPDEVSRVDGEELCQECCDDDLIEGEV